MLGMKGSRRKAGTSRTWASTISTPKPAGKEATASMWSP